MACVDWVWKVVDRLPAIGYGQVQQYDATSIINGTENPIISTDPPYYDNIDYSDLSDFFYIWLRHALSDEFPSIFATLLTPKNQELIASPFRHGGNNQKAKAFFEKGLGEAFVRMRNVQNSGYPLTVYYAFKQAEEHEGGDNDAALSSTGWETMLVGLIQAGFLITGTIPIRTELGSRIVGMDTNALASSIVLVCRPRPSNAPLATRREFITALKQELPLALKTLQQSSISSGRSRTSSDRPRYGSLHTVIESNGVRRLADDSSKCTFPHQPDA